MNSNKGFPFVKKAISPIGICLSALYTNDITQTLVRSIINDHFSLLFEQYMAHAKKKKVDVKHLVEKKDAMKQLFVEYGIPVESIDDLLFLGCMADHIEKIPKFFSYWDMREHVLKTVSINSAVADPNGNTPMEQLPDISGPEEVVEVTKT